MFSHICQRVHEDRKKNIHVSILSYLTGDWSCSPFRCSSPSTYVFYCIKCMLFSNRSSAGPSPHDISHQSFLCNCIAKTDADDVSHFLAHLEHYNFMSHIGFWSINETNGWSHLGFTSDVFDLVWHELEINEKVMLRGSRGGLFFGCLICQKRVWGAVLHLLTIFFQRASAQYSICAVKGNV